MFLLNMKRSTKIQKKIVCFCIYFLSRMIVKIGFIYDLLRKRASYFHKYTKTYSCTVIWFMWSLLLRMFVWANFLFYCVTLLNVARWGQKITSILGLLGRLGL